MLNVSSILHLVGSVNENGEFERGVSTYPTTGAEVHAVCSKRFYVSFSKYYRPETRLSPDVAVVL